MRHILAASFALAVGAVVAISGEQTKPSTQQESNVVVVRRCVRGRTLIADTGTASGTAAPLDTKRYDLTGDKHTLKLLKEHSGHQEEITGKPATPDAGGATRVVDKQSGKNRAYVSVGTASSTDPVQIAAGPMIAIKSLEHLADNCS